MEKSNSNPKVESKDPEVVEGTNSTDADAILTKYNETSFGQGDTTVSGSSGTGNSASDGSTGVPRGRIDLMDLQDFDVQVALTVNLGVQIFEVTDIVTSWMNDSFRQLLLQAGYVGSYADFDTIILLERSSQKRELNSIELDSTGRPLLRREKQLRALQTSTDSNSNANTSTGVVPVAAGALFTAQFKGAALFTRQSNQTAIPKQVVQDMQTITLQQKDAALLQKLKSSTYAVGLGPTFVIDVRTYLASDVPFTPAPATGLTDSSGNSLQLVIIVAIVIACVAFLFLLMAIFWAWRYDKRNRQAYLVKDRPDLAGSSTTGDVEDPDLVKGTTPRTKASTTVNAAPPPVENIRVSYPREIGVVKSPSGECYESNLYPESVISEDISTSLSQYYQQGMVPTRGSAALASAAAYRQQTLMNDAASVSSMESYGYSLDGYAPSMHTPQPTEYPASSLGQEGSAAPKKNTTQSKQGE